MKNTIFLSMACISYIVTTSLPTNALDLQKTNQKLQGENNPLLTRVFHRYNRQYAVYYRIPRRWRGNWMLAGSFGERRDAEIAARRLEQRGYRASIRVRGANNQRGGWGWGRY
jgi:hypothetical protein